MKSRRSSKIQEEEKIAGNENSPSVNGRKEKPSTNRTGRARKGNKKKKLFFCVRGRHRVSNLAGSLLPLHVRIDEVWCHKSDRKLDDITVRIPAGSWRLTCTEGS